MFEVLQIGFFWLLQQLWRALPLFVTLAMMLVSMAPMNLMQGVVLGPDLALIAIFFWAIHGPEFLPPWAVFAVGLAQDFATGSPVGFCAVMYLFAYGFTLSQRVFFRGRTGVGVWLGFAIIAVLMAVGSWVLGTFVYARWLPPGELFGQAAVSVIFYPLLARVLLLLRRALTTAPETLRG
ncbi:MAG: hypothetical protein SGJ03_06110 [Alphaproteobacteria bacterium]|nr:hypothetical protein [Alphaproteobacteria bacterium]